MYCPTLLLCLSLVIFPLEMVSTPVVNCNPGPCRAGQFLNVFENKCLECPIGTFTDQNGHRCQVCRPCTIADPYSYQVELLPCTKTRDTVRGCMDKFYARSSHELDCIPCTVCGQGQKVIESCQGERDTVCGEEEESTTTTDQPTDRNTATSVFYKNTIIVFVVAGITILIIRNII